MNTTTLSNSFHNTTIRVRLPFTLATQADTYRQLLELSDNCAKARGKVTRIRRKLCGVTGCTCGTVR